MAATTLTCPRCRMPVPAQILNLGRLTKCPGCDSGLEAEVFPAFFREHSGAGLGERVLADDDASCFYHPGRKAAGACEYCGRFVCSLCELEFHDQKICPRCLETGREKGRLKALENRCVMYDNIALTLALAGAFCFPFLFSLAALFVVVRYWKAPQSLIRRGRMRMGVAALVAVLGLAGWSVIFLNELI